jgi:uncharacterized protein YkwD
VEIIIYFIFISFYYQYREDKMARNWHRRHGGAGYYSPRRRKGGGILAPVLILALCVLGVFLLTHPDILKVPGGVIVPLPDQQPPPTPTSLVYEEIRARYGNKYDGYEGLIKRTASGGFDTRDADAAMAGQTLAVPVNTPLTIKTLTTNAPGSSEGITQEVESYIFQYTNEERQINGISALIVNSCLAEIARTHSEDMASNNYFSHVNLKGQDPSARASIRGCPIQKPLGGGMTQIGIAENIDKMPTGNVVGYGYILDTSQSVARAQIDSWMNSPGHRANILNPTYSYIGVGTAKDAYGYYISTQDFW